jgi:hypothetical protein
LSIFVLPHLKHLDLLALYSFLALFFVSNVFGGWRIKTI